MNIISGSTGLYLQTVLPSSTVIIRNTGIALYSHRITFDRVDGNNNTYIQSIPLNRVNIHELNHVLTYKV